VQKERFLQANQAIAHLMQNTVCLLKHTSHVHFT